MSKRQTPTIPCPNCGADMEYEPADPNADCDADGNRGHYVAASWQCDCGHTEEPAADELQERWLWLRGEDF